MSESEATITLRPKPSEDKPDGSVVLVTPEREPEDVPEREWFAKGTRSPWAAKGPKVGMK